MERQLYSCGEVWLESRSLGESMHVCSYLMWKAVAETVAFCWCDFTMFHIPWNLVSDAGACHECSNVIKGVQDGRQSECPSSGERRNRHSQRLCDNKRREILVYTMTWLHRIVILDKINHVYMALLMEC